MELWSLPGQLLELLLNLIVMLGITSLVTVEKTIENVCLEYGVEKILCAIVSETNVTLNVLN